jgi:hypothetical protein
VSDVQPKTATFLEQYRDGRVTAQQIDDFIEAWHDSDDSEQRPLSEFLGMTEDEYTVWMASRKALPAIIAARQEGRALVEAAAEHLAQLQRAAQPGDRSAIHVLSHWLQRHASGLA